MSEAKHTPGPWDYNYRCKGHKLGHSDKGVPFAWLNLDAPSHIGGMKISTHASMPLEELEANARLIAAAPELLSVARDAIECIEALESELAIHSGYRCDHLMVDCLRAAIAKAEGSGK